MEYKHVLKFDSDSNIEETEYDPVVNSQYDLHQYIKTETFLTRREETYTPKTLDDMDFSEIGIVTRREPGKEIPTYDEFLQAHIPELESIYVKPPERDEQFVVTKELSDFINGKKLIFYNSGEFEFAEMVYSKIFEIYPDLTIVDLSYRNMVNLRYGREASGLPLSVDVQTSKPFQKVVFSYEIYFDEKTLQLVHKMNKKIYRRIQQLIGDVVPEYLQTIPKIEKVDPEKYGLEEISLTVMDDVFVEKECKNHGVVLGKELSRGQYGVVYDAKLGDDDIVVKSELIRDDDISLNIVQRWKKEIEFQKKAAKIGVAAQILDSWTCPMMDKDKPDGNSKIGFIAMKKINGETLEDYTQRNPSEEEMKKVGEKLRALALDLYRIDIFHNDMHARNIMVEFNKKKTDFVIKVIDFGIVERFSNDTKRAHEQLKSILNEWAYMYNLDINYPIEDLEYLDILREMG